SLYPAPERSAAPPPPAARGPPPALTRATMPEQLLASDSPLFINNGDVLTTLRALAADPELLSRARARAQQAVKPYSMTATAQRFREYFARAEADPATAGQLRIRDRKHRVVVAGHDFKFASELFETLQQRDDIELRVDKWHRLAAHDKDVSLELAK